MNFQNKSFPAAKTLLITVIAFVAFYLALIRVDSLIRNHAIDECGKLGRQEQTTNNLNVSYPLSDIYESCLERKGIN